MPPDSKQMRDGLRYMLIGHYVANGHIDLGSSELSALFGNLVSKSLLMSMVDDLIDAGHFKFTPKQKLIPTKLPKTGSMDAPSIAKMLRDFKDLFKDSKIIVSPSSKDFVLMRVMCGKYGWEKVYEKFDEFKQFLISGRGRGTTKTRLDEFKSVCFERAARRRFKREGKD